MFLICRDCKKVYVDGKWLVGVPPIGSVQYTLCPDCGHEDSNTGMAYMEKQRAADAKKKKL